MAPSPHRVEIPAAPDDDVMWDQFQRIMEDPTSERYAKVRDVLLEPFKEKPHAKPAADGR